MLKACLRHLKVISRHKYYVMCECFKRGLYWQGIVHDLSKFTLSEFIPSAMYFQGTGTPIVKERAEKGYSSAWLHHKGRNKHHWDYWVDFGKGKMILCKIPDEYILEMCCDMIGASKAYLGGQYHPCEPYNYFQKNKKDWFMEKSSMDYIESLLKKEAAKGVFK